MCFCGYGLTKTGITDGAYSKTHQAVYQGLGGSFDVYTGYVKRAPKWWVSNNMEWTYRLLRQPSRIKRQIHLASIFLLNLHLNRY